MRAPARRWLIVLALFVVTYGISTPLAAYGVFLPVLAETFGWSRGAIATALSINLMLGGVAGFVIGALADRHGPRLMLVLTVDTVLLAVLVRVTWASPRDSPTTRGDAVQLMDEALPTAPGVPDAASARRRARSDRPRR